MVNLRVKRCIWWSLVAKDIFRILKITLYNQGVGCHCGHLWSWFLIFFQHWWVKLQVYYWYTATYIGFSWPTSRDVMPFTQGSWICKGHPPTKNHLKDIEIKQTERHLYIHPWHFPSWSDSPLFFFCFFFFWGGILGIPLSNNPFTRGS